MPFYRLLIFPKELTEISLECPSGVMSSLILGQTVFFQRLSADNTGRQKVNPYKIAVLDLIFLQGKTVQDHYWVFSSPI